MNSCPRCNDFVIYDACDCGWKKPAATTITLKTFDYPEDNKSLNNTLAYQLADWEKRAAVDEMAKRAPSLKSGATKKDVSNYWMGNIRMILGAK